MSSICLYGGDYLLEELRMVQLPGQVKSGAAEQGWIN